jgi:hypothetical protein
MARINKNITDLIERRPAQSQLAALANPDAIAAKRGSGVPASAAQTPGFESPLTESSRVETLDNIPITQAMTSVDIARLQSLSVNDPSGAPLIINLQL